MCDLHALHFAMCSGRSAGDGVAVLACKAWLWVGEYHTLQRGTREGELLLSQPLVALTHHNMVSLYHRPARMSAEDTCVYTFLPFFMTAAIGSLFSS